MKLNTNLEETLNLAPYDYEDITVPEETSLVINKENAYSELDKIDAALSQVNLDSSDDEFDTIASQAMESYRDIFDLAMNSEPRLQAELFGVAGNFMAHGITAKTNKIKTKLDRIALQIKKQIADGKTKGSDDIPLEGKATIFDRNQLLDMLKKPEKDK